MMTPADRIHVYVGEPLRRLLDAWSSGDSEQREHEIRSASQAVNTAADRYLEVCRRSLPTLSEQEWLACADALNGVWISDHSGGAAYLSAVWTEIADADRLNGLGETWGIDGQALARRIREAPYAEQVALVDLIERLWARSHEDWRALLLMWGAIAEVAPALGRGAARGANSRDARIAEDEKTINTVAQAIKHIDQLLFAIEHGRLGAALRVGDLAGSTHAARMALIAARNDLIARRLVI